MQIIDPQKLLPEREFYDREVTRYFMEHGGSRMDGYIELARQAGYSMRALESPNGWACVIGITQCESFRDIQAQFQSAIKSILDPLSRRSERLGSLIDREMAFIADQLAAAKSGNELDIKDVLVAKANRARQLTAEQKTIADQMQQSVENLLKDFAIRVGTLLKESVVVIGENADTAMLGALLLMLDQTFDVVKEDVDEPEHVFVESLAGKFKRIIASDTSEPIELFDSIDHAAPALGRVALLLTAMSQSIPPDEDQG